MRSAGSVLLVGNFLSAAGKNRNVCEDLAGRLSIDGWNVVTTSSHVGRSARLLDMISTAWRRRNEFEVAHLDVFSGASFLWAEAVATVLRAAGKPFVLTLRGGALPDFSRRHPKRVRRLLESASAVTVPSLYLHSLMRDYRADLLLLPNPVDCRLFHFRLHSPAAARLVWVRAFHRIYNPPLAVQVLAHIAKSHATATLRMVGPDKGDGSLEETVSLAGELGVDNRLTIIPGVPLSHVPAHLRTGDIFLNTSNIDNVPVSVLQAMSAGLCVVSTDVGGIPYLLEHQRDSLLVPPADAPAMAAAVERLHANPTAAAALSRNARLKAEQSDWPLYLARWKELLLSLSPASPVRISEPQPPVEITV